MIRVLIIDDVDSMRALLEHMIAESEGLAVSGLARNGTEARLELRRRRPDFILLDEVLPGESSTDLLHEIQKEGIPVLLLTGLTDATHPVPPGVIGRLLKPTWETLKVDRPRFLRLIQDAIRAAKKI